MPGRAVALHFRSNDASFYPTLHPGHSPETDGDHGFPSTGALAQHAKVTEPARISCSRCHPRGELPAGNRSRARRQSPLARSRYKASFMLGNLQRSSGLMGGYVQRGWRFHCSGIPLESRRGNLWEARVLADGCVRDPMLAADPFIDPRRTRTSPPGSWGYASPVRTRRGGRTGSPLRWRSHPVPRSRGQKRFGSIVEGGGQVGQFSPGSSGCTDDHGPAHLPSTQKYPNL